MVDYAREMLDLKTIVARTLKNDGVLAKIRAELRASIFEAIEEEDTVLVNEDNVPPALLGSCNDQAKQLHVSPSASIKGKGSIGTKLLLCDLVITSSSHGNSYLQCKTRLYTTNPICSDSSPRLALEGVLCIRLFFLERLLTALVSEYLELTQLGHTFKVYLPDCNLPKDF